MIESKQWHYQQQKQLRSDVFVLETRLYEYDFLHCRCELSIHPEIQIEKKTFKNQRQQSGETCDPLTRASQPAKKAIANEARHRRRRIYESIQGKCFHLHFYSRLVSCSLGESVQPAQNLMMQLVVRPSLIPMGLKVCKKG